MVYWCWLVLVGWCWCWFVTFFKGGYITKEEYNVIKTLDENNEIEFGNIANYTPAVCDLHEINVSENEKDIIRFIKGNKRTRFNLMEYFYEEEILNGPDGFISRSITVVTFISRTAHW